MSNFPNSGRICMHYPYLVPILNVFQRINKWHLWNTSSHLIGLVFGEDCANMKHQQSFSKKSFIPVIHPHVHHIYASFHKQSSSATPTNRTTSWFKFAPEIFFRRNCNSIQLLQHELMTCAEVFLMFLWFLVNCA